MTKTFIIKQDMNYFEFLSAMFYQVSTMKLVRRLFLFSFIISLGSLLLDLTTSSYNRDWNHIIFDSLLYPLFFLFFFLFIVLVGAGVLIITRPNHFKNVTYTFTHWGMEKVGKDIEFSRPWSKFLKFKESKHFIFLFITNNDAHIIQKRMFKSNDEVQSFIQLILDHLRDN